MMDVASRWRICLGLIVVVTFIYAFVEAANFSRLASYLPRSMAAAGFLCAAALVATDLVRLRRQGTCVPAGAADDTATLGAAELDVRSELASLALRQMLWVLGYVLLLAGFGFFVGTAVFLPVFLRTVTKLRWLSVGLAVVAMTLFFHFLSDLVRMALPSGAVI